MASNERICYGRRLTNGQSADCGAYTQQRRSTNTGTEQD